MLIGWTFVPGACALRRCISGLSAALCALSMTIGVAHADDGKGTARSGAALFDRVCLEVMPDAASVLTLAKQEAWEGLSKAEFELLKPSVTPDVMHGWRGEQAGESFSLVITEAAPDTEMLKVAPEIAGTRQHACSVMLPHATDVATVSDAVIAIMERQPDAIEDSGASRFLRWSGESDTMIVLIQAIVPKAVKGVGVLSSTIWVKSTDE